MKYKEVIKVSDIEHDDLRRELEESGVKSINKIDGESVLCATCGFWERGSAISSRTGFIIPNALCECAFMVGVLIDKKYPASVKSAPVLWNEGESCSRWQYLGKPVQIMIV